MKKTEAHRAVQEAYGAIAEGASPGCCGSGGGCGGGYSGEELAAAPAAANLGLGCGNPTALASLKPGEVVLDLGSGPGLDAFIAAGKVGPAGRVIGVDMTPQMIRRATRTAEEGRIRNVEFRLGAIEALPVADASVDVVISNCVINLSPDKPRVLREILRVLRSGGRVAISDVAIRGELPPEVKNDPKAFVGCVSGAITIEDYSDMLRAAGFRDVRVRAAETAGDETCESPAVSVSVEARK